MRSAREFRWNELPYGFWQCTDGREVLFNRRYKPIYERQSGIATPARRDEWVKYKQQHYFYDDGCIPTNARLKRILAAFQRGDDLQRWVLR